MPDYRKPPAVREWQGPVLPGHAFDQPNGDVIHICNQKRLSQWKVESYTKQGALRWRVEVGTKEQALVELNRHVDSSRWPKGKGGLWDG